MKKSQEAKLAYRDYPIAGDARKWGQYGNSALFLLVADHKLTRFQSDALCKVGFKWQNATQIGVWEGELDALTREGLIERRVIKGSWFFLPTNVQYRRGGAHES